MYVEISFLISSITLFGTKLFQAMPRSQQTTILSVFDKDTLYIVPYLFLASMMNLRYVLEHTVFFSPTIANAPESVC